MSLKRTYAEINERIRKGEAVVITAEEAVALSQEVGVEEAARRVDVVTTGTFGPMCSSGVFLNFGHSQPRIKMKKVWLNGVNAYAGLAAVDAYLGATEIPDNDPENSVYPGRFTYGGGHVIEDLVARRPIKLEATAYPTSCYPRRRIETTITLDDINEAFLFNPRNAYQNYNVAVNLSHKILHTYLGRLLPNLGNATYCSAGQLSPLLKDPYYRAIGIGARIFLGGGVGYVAWNGTQHNPGVPRGENGVPQAGAGTLAVTGDLKQMRPEWLRGVSVTGYGTSLAVGIGVPIPVLDEEAFRRAAVSDAEIFAPVVDYSDAYPQRKAGNLGLVSYAELKSGRIVVQGKEVRTSPMSSYPAAVKIAETLKQWIQKGEFLLTEPVQALPSVDAALTVKTLEIRENGGR
ncbi:MAG: hypothetical protein HPY50_22590 [Firmicutes bacterium]|nr:hypothetical protein [Bacillota bacterium]